jgi:hypothetical protein
MSCFTTERADLSIDDGVQGIFLGWIPCERMNSSSTGNTDMNRAHGEHGRFGSDSVFVSVFGTSRVLRGDRPRAIVLR